MALRTKTTVREKEIWLSFAPTIGETAAIALPPQIAVPEEIKNVVFLSTLRIFPKKTPNKKTKSTEQAVKIMPFEDTSMTCCKFIPNPISTTEYCKIGEEYFLNWNGFSIFRSENKIPQNNAIGAETNGKRQRIATI